MTSSKGYRGFRRTALVVSAVALLAATGAGCRSAAVPPATPSASVSHVPSPAAASPTSSTTPSPTAVSAPSGTPTVSATPLSTVSTAWVGDMNFGNPGAGAPAGGAAILAGVASELRSDLTGGNLETALGAVPATKCPTPTPAPLPPPAPTPAPTASGAVAQPSPSPTPTVKTCYVYVGPAQAAATMAAAGFSVVNLANNHSNDAGGAGVTSTEKALKAAGVAWAGRPGEITYLTANGVSVAVLGFAPYASVSNALNLTAAQALVAQAKQQAQLVVVMMHLGAEGTAAQHVTGNTEYYLGENRGNPQAFAHGVIDAGADLVVGSGPHVLRGFEWYQGHLIAYSLGDFAGYHTFSETGVFAVSAVLHVTLDSSGSFVSGSVTPLRLRAPGTPYVDQAGTALTTINSLSIADFGDAGAVVGADGTIAPPA